MSFADPAAPIALDQRLARTVARLVSRTPVTPNMLTGLGLLIGLLAAWDLAHGAPLAYWGAGLFMLAMWMDHLDGEVARMTGRTSTFGHYFDHVAMMTGYLGMFVGSAIGVSDGWLGPAAIWLGIAAGIAMVSIFSVRMWIEVTRGLDAVRQEVHRGFQVEDTLYLVGPVIWLGLTPYFIALAGIGTPVYFVYVIWDARRRDR